jgi:hypothetical protein
MNRSTFVRGLTVPGAIFAGAFVVRLVGIDFGLPYMYHWDEHYLVTPIRQFLISGDLLPHMYCYPSAYIYLQFLFTPISYLLFILKGGPAARAAMNPADFVLVGRSVTACVGAAAAVLVYYFAGRIWRDRLAGVIAAAVLALSPLHAMDSRYLTTDVPMATAAFLGFFLLSLYLEKRSTKVLVWAGAAFGAAVAFKYNAAFFVAAAVAVVAVNDRSWRRPLALGGAAVLGFLVLMPGMILENAVFRRDVHFISTEYFVTGYEKVPVTFIYIPYIRQLWLYTMTPAPLLCAAAGLAVLLYRGRWRAAPFLILPAAYVVFLAVPRVYFNRGLEPVLPYACLLAGLGAAVFLRSIKRKLKPAVAGAAAAAFLVLLFVRPAALTAREAAVLTREDRRTAAKEWFEAEAPWPACVAKEARNSMPQVQGGQTETPPIDADKYDVRTYQYLVCLSADDLARAGVVYLMTPNLKAEYESFSRVFPSRAKEGRRDYDSILENSEQVLYLPSPRRDFRPAVEIYRLHDDVLRRNNPPRKDLCFREKWVCSEEAPFRKMPRAEGRFVLEAPARAGACFTAPAERFRLTAVAERLAGEPRLVLEVDGVEVAAEELRGTAAVATSPLAAPPYFRHLAVRCLGPPGSRAKLKSAVVEPAP